jgi:hypothetical protein
MGRAESRIFASKFGNVIGQSRGCHSRTGGIRADLGFKRDILSLGHPGLVLWSVAAQAVPLPDLLKDYDTNFIVNVPSNAKAVMS